MLKRRIVGSTVLGAVISGLVIGPPVFAKDPAPNPGKTLYDKNCASCHGVTGKGDGTLAKLMTPKPTDLTQLAKKAGGKFPMIEVLGQIDGTLYIAAHGTSEMPVWGDKFTAETTAGVEDHAMVRGKLLLVTQYVASIQEK